MSTTILAERIELLEGTLNAEARTVEAVLIRPGWSANGRYYSREALTAAAAKFEGAKAYANHPTPRQLKEGEGRDVRDLTGQYTNVRIGEGGELRATRRMFDTPSGNAIWPLIVASVGSTHPPIGVSINALGKGSKGKVDGREGLIVESIDIVNSADDVDTPAAGGGFERLIADSGPTLIADLLKLATYEEITEARPDVLDSVRKQMKRARQDDAVRALVEERDAAQAALETARAELQTINEQLATTRAELARTEKRVVLEMALRDAQFNPEYEALLRQELEKIHPDRWVEVMQSEKAKRSADGVRRVQVYGTPLREAQPVTIGTPYSTAPLRYSDFDSPQAFLAAIRAREAKGNH